MTNKISVKLSSVGMGFLDRLRTNRRDPQIGTDKRDSPNWKLLEIVFQYFKKNDKLYQELLKMEYSKNV